MKPKTSPLIVALALGGALAWPIAASAADAPAKPATKVLKKQSKAKGMALAEETVQRISEAQLLVADRVLTGDAACEFNQKVSVLPVKDKPGHFHVAFKKVVYNMLPKNNLRSVPASRGHSRGGLRGLRRGPSKCRGCQMVSEHRVGQKLTRATWSDTKSHPGSQPMARRASCGYSSGSMASEKGQTTR